MDSPFCKLVATLIAIGTGLSQAYAWDALPKQPPVPADNPQTAEKVELGKKLYFDPRLSLTGTVSCNSCHNVMEGGDDGRAVSMGILGLTGERNAPTVWNSAYQSSQFWDGRAATLEDQAIGPIVASPEMGMPSHEVAIKRLRTIPAYVEEFDHVFPDSGLTIGSVAKAIAAFERTLVTPDNAYDQFVNGNIKALTVTQKRGLELFENVGCTECHSGAAFNGWSTDTDEPMFVEFPRFTETSDVAKYNLTSDPGRSNATNDPEDKGQFKTPTLRNISLTAPYFHNGQVTTLPEAVRVMGTTQLGERLSNEQVGDIVAFLEVLEGPFPQIALPRLPSRSGQSIINDGAVPASANETSVR